MIQTNLKITNSTSSRGLLVTITLAILSLLVTATVQAQYSPGETIIFDEQQTTSSELYFNDQRVTLDVKVPHTVEQDFRLDYPSSVIIKGSYLQVNGEIQADDAPLIIDGVIINSPADPPDFRMRYSPVVVKNSGIVFANDFYFDNAQVIDVYNGAQLRVMGSIKTGDYDYHGMFITINNGGSLVVEKDMSLDYSYLTLDLQPGGTLTVKGNIHATPTKSNPNKKNDIQINGGTLNVGRMEVNGTFSMNSGTVNGIVEIFGSGPLDDDDQYNNNPSGFIHGGNFNGTLLASNTVPGAITGGHTQNIILTSPNQWEMTGGFVENFTVADHANPDIQGGEIFKLHVTANANANIVAEAQVDMLQATSNATVTTYASSEIVAAYGNSFISFNGSAYSGIVAGEQGEVTMESWSSAREVIAIDEGFVDIYGNTSQIHNGEPDTIVGGEIDVPFVVSAMDQALVELHIERLTLVDPSGGQFGHGYLQGTWSSGDPFEIDLRNDFGVTFDHLLFNTDKFYGDANGDSVVDLADLVILGENYNSDDNVTFSQGDFDENGIVDLADLICLSENYGVDIYSPSEHVSTSESVIPEPSSLLLFTTAALIITRRRPTPTVFKTLTKKTYSIPISTLLIVILAVLISMSLTVITNARTLTWINPDGGNGSNMGNWLPEDQLPDDHEGDLYEADDDLVFNLPAEYKVDLFTGVVRSLTFANGQVTYVGGRSSQISDSVMIAPESQHSATANMLALDETIIHNAIHVGGSNFGPGGKATLNLGVDYDTQTYYVYGPIRVWPEGQLNIQNSLFIGETIEVLGSFNFLKDNYDPDGYIPDPSEIQANIEVKQSGVANIFGGLVTYNGLSVSGQGRANIYDGFVQQVAVSSAGQAIIDNAQIPQVVASGQSVITIAGGDIDTLAAYDDATIHIVAREAEVLWSTDDTEFEDEFSFFGKYGDGIIRGIWQDGESFEIDLLDLGGLTKDRIFIDTFLPGDVNADGIVDLVDLTTLGENYGQAVPSRLLGDLDNNGIVDLVDLTTLGENYNSASTPEPTSMATVVLALATLSLARRSK